MKRIDNKIKYGLEDLDRKIQGDINLTMETVMNEFMTKMDKSRQALLDTIQADVK